MAGQNTITISDLNALGTGSSAGVHIDAGLYKYAISGSFGTTSTVKMELGFGSSWVDVDDILGNQVTNTSATTVEESWDVYIPTCLVRLTVSGADVTSGSAWIAPVLTQNV